MARLWVWLHLPGLSLKIKTKTFKVTNSQKFSPSKISHYMVKDHQVRNA